MAQNHSKRYKSSPHRAANATGSGKQEQRQAGAVSMPTIRWVRIFLVSISLLAGTLILWATALTVNREGETARLAALGWGPYAVIIVANKVRSLWHASFMAGTAVLGCWLLTTPKFADYGRLRLAVAVGFVMIVCADAIALSNHYVKTVPKKALVGSNVVVDFLKRHLQHGRVLCLDQSGFYNTWLSVLFPFHKIEAFNILQWPRIPADYDAFLRTLNGNPFRLWQLSAVRYVLAPAQVSNQLRQDARAQEWLEPVLGFNVAVANGEIAVEQATPERAAHWLLHFPRGLPRFGLFSAWSVVSDAEALKRLPMNEFDPLREVLVAPDSVPLTSVGNGERSVMPVKAEIDQRGTITVRTSSDSPGILMFVQHYNPSWRAWVDGRSAPVLKCNYILLGVYLEAGQHEVKLAYRPPLKGLAIQGAGLAACLMAGGWLAARHAARK